MLYSDRVFQKKVILVLGDVGIFFLSLVLALSMRQQRFVSADQFFGHLNLFVPIFVVSLGVYFLFDLYNLRVLKSISRLTYLLIAASIANSVIATSFLYVFSIFSPYSPRTVLLLFTILVFFLTLAWRFMFWDIFFAGFRYVRRVIIVGADRVEENLSRIVSGDYGIDYRIVGFVSVDERVARSPLAGVPYLGSSDRLRDIIGASSVNEIVVAFEFRSHPELVKELSESVSLGVRIYEWPAFYEQVFQKIPANHIDHFWFIGNLDETDKRLYERSKRVIDVVAALVGIVVLGIVIPLVALGTKLTSPGPLFFRQRRIGLGGKTFLLTKFRTMRTDAEKDGAVWASKNDSRITSFGRFLRRTRLDELPQFLNILTGDMSLVGPRPERPEFIGILDEKIPFYSRRNMVRPGITGFAQIMYPYAASVEDSLEKVGYDLYYIKHRSLFLYFKILLRTVRVVLLMRGM